MAIEDKYFVVITKPVVAFCFLKHEAGLAVPDI
jgi:hypothetical protein